MPNPTIKRCRAAPPPRRAPRLGAEGGPLPPSRPCLVPLGRRRRRPPRRAPSSARRPWFGAPLPSRMLPRPPDVSDLRRRAQRDAPLRPFNERALAAQGAARARPAPSSGAPSVSPMCGIVPASPPTAAPSLPRRRRAGAALPRDPRRRHSQSTPLPDRRRRALRLLADGAHRRRAGVCRRTSPGGNSGNACLPARRRRAGACRRTSPERASSPAPPPLDARGGHLSRPRPASAPGRAPAACPSARPRRSLALAPAGGPLQRAHRARPPPDPNPRMTFRAILPGLAWSLDGGPPGLRRALAGCRPAAQCNLSLPRRDSPSKHLATLRRLAPLLFGHSIPLAVPGL